MINNIEQFDLLIARFLNLAQRSGPTADATWLKRASKLTTLMAFMQQHHRRLDAVTAFTHPQLGQVHPFGPYIPPVFTLPPPDASGQAIGLPIPHPALAGAIQRFHEPGVLSALEQRHGIYHPLALESNKLLARHRIPETEAPKTPPVWKETSAPKRQQRESSSSTHSTFMLGEDSADEGPSTRTRSNKKRQRSRTGEDRTQEQERQQTKKEPSVPAQAKHIAWYGDGTDIGISDPLSILADTAALISVMESPYTF